MMHATLFWVKATFRNVKRFIESIPFLHSNYFYRMYRLSTCYPSINYNFVLYERRGFTKLIFKVSVERRNSSKESSYSRALGFHSVGQYLCKFIGTKDSVYIRREFNSRTISWEH